MHTPRRTVSYALLVIMLALASVHSAAAADDPLPSWIDGITKRTIVDFVQRVTTPGGKDFVPECPWQLRRRPPDAAVDRCW